MTNDSAGQKIAETSVTKEHTVDALSRITATVLLLVLMSVGWIVVAAYQRDWAGVALQSYEVLCIVVLLGTALLLVSATALRQTRQ
jgi:hypothetical protein